jgi:hypothetical protein
MGGGQKTAAIRLVKSHDVRRSDLHLRGLAASVEPKLLPRGPRRFLVPTHRFSHVLTQPEGLLAGGVLVRVLIFEEQVSRFRTRQWMISCMAKTLQLVKLRFGSWFFRPVHTGLGVSDWNIVL